MRVTSQIVLLFAKLFQRCCKKNHNVITIKWCFESLYVYVCVYDGVGLAPLAGVRC